MDFHEKVRGMGQKDNVWRDNTDNVIDLVPDGDAG